MHLTRARLRDFRNYERVEIAFGPGLNLVRGPPAGRRAHLDRVVAALWPARAATRGAYSRALAQRNALIGRVRAGAAAADLLDPWDVELAHQGAQLMADRAAAIELA